jgi:hypothetical protein
MIAAVSRWERILGSQQRLLLAALPRYSRNMQRAARRGADVRSVAPMPRYHTAGAGSYWGHMDGALKPIFLGTF